MLVYESGIIELFKSVFKYNYDDRSQGVDGTGIANLDGSVECDSDADCIQVCDVCRDEDETEEAEAWWSPPPTPSYTPPPSQTSLADATTKARLFAVVWALVVGCLALLVGMTVALRRRRGCGDCGRTTPDAAPNRELSLCTTPEAAPSLELPLLGRADGLEPETEETEAGSVQLILRSVLNGSPAPMVVIGRDMRIKFWSPGMAIAAPTVEDPASTRLSDLPFASEGAGTRLFEEVERMFDDALAERGSGQPLMLHLRTQAGPVLLEMAANALVTASGPVVVMTGREVNPELASLMLVKGSCDAGHNRDAERKDAYDDEEDADGGDDCARSESKMSKISGVTLPTCYQRSEATHDHEYDGNESNTEISHALASDEEEDASDVASGVGCETVLSATRLVSLYQRQNSINDNRSTSTDGANAQVGWAPPGAMSAHRTDAAAPSESESHGVPHWRQRYLNRFSNAHFREKNEQFLELGNVAEGSDAHADSDTPPQL